MAFVRHTIEISREKLAGDRLKQIWQWPGCQDIRSVGVLGDLRGGFTIHVTDYGSVKIKLADRAVRCIQREQQRHHHLKVE